MLDQLNRKIEDYFGRAEDRPRYRVVWSEDEFEMRHGTFNDYTSNGLFIRQVTETRQVPKYRQWIQNTYILEQLTIYENHKHDGSMVESLGYEPVYTFRQLGKEGIPSFEACKFLIEVVITGMKSPGTYFKYKDPLGNPEQARAEHEAEINKLMKELFGNETDVGDALRYKEGIVVPDHSIN